MGKKRRIIKRVYENGREKTVLHAKKESPVYKQITKLPATRRRYVKEETVIARPRLVEHPITRRQDIDKYELPSHYGTTRITLMVKDPFWLYAYWEIAQDSLSSLKNSLPQQEIENAKIVLRMYDVTLKDFNGTNANHYFDIEVGPHINNWYINLWNDNVSYIGDIGLRISEGRFFTMARSNCVYTPRITYSPRSEQIWMSVRDEPATQPYTVQPTNASCHKFLQETLGTVPSGPYYQESKSRGTNISQLYAKSVSRSTAVKKRIIYLTEEDIRYYYSGLSPLLRDIISSRLSKPHHRRSGGHSFILEGETAEERQMLFSMLPKDYFIKRMLLGSSQELIVVGGSEGRLGRSSEFIQNKIKHHKFFFELAAELIVYGRTEPDAELWLGDKKIQLRNDGTFSLRFALPDDGKIPLGFTAISHDKEEKRRIDTDVERRTKCR